VIRSGYVGAGFAAAFHHESLLSLRSLDIRPVGVFSPRSSSREAFAAERELEAFDSLNALFQAVDVVHVCVPPAFHESVTTAALKAGISAIVEKPFTGYFGPPNDESFRGDSFPKKKMLQEALASAARMLAAEADSPGRIYYAENWIFAPVIQKEAEIITKTGAQILWIIAEESHSGSHSPTYGIWRYSGGGSIMGKGTHPLTTALYLKRLEGLTRSGQALRPQSVSARTHAITRLPAFRDAGFLRTDYHDVEDFALMHLTFSDGTVADIFASEIVMGGVHNWLEVLANNHRTRCNINPMDGLETYNPAEAQFEDIYVVEKIGSKQGWSKPAPDENWMNGYVQEMQEFYTCIDSGKEPVSSSGLGRDTVAVIYSAYLSAERGGAEIEIPG
jgi:predicted dehydrogenase